MPREQRFRPEVNVERLEGRELTTSLSGSEAGLAGVEGRQVEVRAVTAANVAAVNYLVITGFFMS
jgi:hypothetical protein